MLLSLQELEQSCSPLPEVLEVSQARDKTLRDAASS
jgi:hypothetical protein